jgi:hypothetical protein
MLYCEEKEFVQHTYNDTNEYRNEMRRIFCMDSSNYPDIDASIDSESKDELEYDEKTMSVALDRIYVNTKDHPIFKEIFEKAAACMFSTDPEIGLAVLCSYDYLDVFIPCYREYMLTGMFDTTSIYYVNLFNKLYG